MDSLVNIWAIASGSPTIHQSKIEDLIIEAEGGEKKVFTFSVDIAPVALL